MKLSKYSFKLYIGKFQAIEVYLFTQPTSMHAASAQANYEATVCATGTKMQTHQGSGQLS